MISFKDRARLRIQILIDWMIFPIVGAGTLFYLYLFRQARFINLAETRKKYREAMARGRPTLLCSNHLTMFDSLFIHLALAPFPAYFFKFRLLSWNVPAIENFKATFIMALYTYLGKCIPIDRKGDPAHQKAVLNQIRYLLEIGQSCLIFPEGGRSRSGRIEPENVTYGAGQILMELSGAQVICLYMRGAHQESYGHMPVKGEKFYLAADVIEPRTELDGMRGARELSRQIINRIKELEDEYFETYKETQD